MARFIGPVDDEGRRQTEAPQGRDEGLGLSMSERGLGTQPLALWASSAQPCHLRGRAGVIDEDEAAWLKLHPGLTPGHPLLASFGDVGSILLAGQQRF
ncbi:hypothetical protein [Devosia naphthalenivorans]|uniref:hypothetical protein n=1 Tax=Devosia naphthalenivorans TaxID=2082392 RepID=UPI003CCBF56A